MWVVQQYISRPLLIGGSLWGNTPMRKFDIRMFGLAQMIDGIHFRGYFFRDGYIRTSSYPFDLSDLEDRDVHLTNDAVQDKNSSYGEYEPGNKISLADFATYLQNLRGVDFYRTIYPNIKKAITTTLKALWARVTYLYQEQGNSTSTPSERRIQKH